MQTVTESFLTSPDGTRLSYRTLGDGPVIVIAHGALGFSEDYLATASLLADRFRVALLDRRAYRRSDRGPEPVTFAQDGADVAALLAELDVPCVVFGHSGGTFGALHASALRPPQLRAVSLYEPPFEFVGERARPAMEEVLRLHRAGDDLRSLATFIAYTSMPGGTVEDALSELAQGPGPLQWMGPRIPGMLRDAEAVVSEPGDAARWAGLAVPCQLIVGGSPGHDPRLVRSVEQLAHVLPGARVDRLEGQGHLAPMEAPALLAATIADFAAHLP